MGEHNYKNTVYINLETNKAVASYKLEYKKANYNKGKLKMGTSVIGNPDSQVWKVLGIEVEEDDKNIEDENEENEE